MCSTDSIQSVIEIMFSRIDSDKSGCITQQEMDAVFKVFDSDGNGTVSRSEWVETFTNEFGGSIEQADKIFSKLDKDGSGDISLAEVSQLFRDMDADGNGNVSKEEFISVWLKKPYISYKLYLLLDREPIVTENHWHKDKDAQKGHQQRYMMTSCVILTSAVDASWFLCFV